MSDESQGPQNSPPRSTATKLSIGFVALAVFAVLPEFLMTNFVVWIGVSAAVWVVVGLLKFTAVGYAGAAAFFAVPGLWATVQTVRLAIARAVERDAETS